jgi:hypothetical protein
MLYYTVYLQFALLRWVCICTIIFSVNIFIFLNHLPDVVFFIDCCANKEEQDFGSKMQRKCH